MRTLLAVAVAALAAAPAAGARTHAPPLDQRLARALAVPHIAQSRSGAAVLDLTTGRAVFGQNGRRLVEERYTWTRVTDTYESLYQAAVAEHTPRRPR